MSLYPLPDYEPEPDPSDRLPPQDLAAERSLLGAMLLDRRAVEDVVDVVTGRDFYRPAHELVFAAIIGLYARGERSDVILVGDELTRLGQLPRAGGAPYLHDLVSAVVTSANASYYAQIVAEKAVLRRMVEAGTKIAQLGYTQAGEVSDLVAAGHAAMDGVQTVQRVEPCQERDVYAALEALNSPAGVETPWPVLTDAIGGWRPGNMYIVGARPGMGKTLVGLRAAADMARRGKRALFCSFEMPNVEIQHRLICAAGDVAMRAVQHRQLTDADWSRVSRAVGYLATLPLTIDANPSQSVVDIKTHARKLARHEELGLVVVDYLQLMTSLKDRENRQVEVSAISRAVKTMALELDVPVIAISQLSRAPEGRHDRKPELTDLRESGSLEQDADVVLLLHYDREEDPTLLNMRVAKNRHGENDVWLKLLWEGHFARVSDWPVPQWTPSGSVR